MNPLSKILVVGLVAISPVIAFAQGIVTQRVNGVSNDLPRVEFYEQINDAVSDLANEDIPDMIGALNYLYTNGAPGAIPADDGYTTTGGVSAATLGANSASVGSATVSNNLGAVGVVASGYVTDRGRRAVLGPDGTNSYVIERGTGATNAQIIVFTTPFTGTPIMFVYANTYSATNGGSGVSSINPTQAVLSTLGAGTFNWMAIGTK